MKRKFLYPLSLLALFVLVGCGTPSSISGGASSATTQNSEQTSTQTYNDPVSIESPDSIDVSEQTGDFSFTTKDGAFEQNSNVYTIKTAGTYTCSGRLEGQILVEAGEDDEVVLELDGATIAYDQDSPIKAVTASKLEVSAKKETQNSVLDKRAAKSSEQELGEGAISADVDLKLKGSGTLVVDGGYNNGVHTSKDLTIQKLSLKATGYNNALKGKDNVTISSGTVQAYAKTGNGIKTDDSDLSQKGKQRGTIAIHGGSIYVDSLRDGIDASYDVTIDEEDSLVPTTVIVKTGTNATYYSKSTFKADSEKGIKAANNISVASGTIQVAASDDAIHANYGDALDNGEQGQGNITVSGGVIQVASGDDGLHADNTLSVQGGTITVTGSTEGFEANYVNISGGASYIYGTDDGVNCSKKSFNNCGFAMSGGYLDVAVRSGDTDGIDSNGYWTLTGGTIVTRGSPGTAQGMSTGLDVDGTLSMTGGTLIAFNGLEKSPSAGGSILYAGTSGAQSQGGRGGRGGPGGGPSGGSASISSGKFSLTGDGLSVNFINDYAYASFQIYSSSLVQGSSYTLSREGSALYTWNQSSTSVTIS